LTTDEFLALLARLSITWRDPPRPYSHTIIRPRQEVTEALLRWQRHPLRYYAPELGNQKLGVLYEYSAQYMMRDTILDPTALAGDLIHYLRDYEAWWEQWRRR